MARGVMVRTRRGGAEKGKGSCIVIGGGGGVGRTTWCYRWSIAVIFGVREEEERGAVEVRDGFVGMWKCRCGLVIKV